MAASSTLGVVVGVRLLDAHYPEWLLPGLTAAASAAGIFMALSPLVAGVSFGESHDVHRLAHFPVPSSTLVLSTLVTSLVKPLVLVQVPAVLALGLVLARDVWTAMLTTSAVLLTFLFDLVAAQIVGLLLNAAARRRSVHDLVVFSGLLLGFLLSFLPIVFVVGAGGGLLRVGQRILAHDVLALVPFGWGVRAAVSASRGELVAFGAWAGAAAAALLVAVGVAAALAERLSRGELDLGTAPFRSRGEGPRVVLPGAFLALVEKDAKLLWRDPRVRAALATGLIAPAVLLAALSSGVAQGRSGGLLFFIAAFTGLGVAGSNAFALERRGITLLLMLPTSRTTILAAKNAVSFLLRVPALLLLGAASLVLAEPGLMPFVLATALVAALMAAGADNFLAILVPTPVPAAGQDPWASTSGTRGIAAFALGTLSFAAAAVATMPFAFLVAMPLLLGRPAFGLVFIPLALAGAGGAYFMLIRGAARLLVAREADLVSRILVEE